ncbi:hypothetical protein QDW26_gp65 [Microbacterium phage Didgeridoo]|uniref:hypothetical protein n=1 Tax=Microbacterium phage Didgeridoo TaxID=2126928 RepID=UPI000D218CB2|nr:hypothetical protein QDW26_gp65 [Microbacterium phage Didgeridoo]AVR56731.1 hypothetical protein PBI_DIDGERIDOO_66 [Microbacterium phage Didgeridoo]
MSNTAPAVKALRKAVDNAKGPADGTVVRFVRTVSGDYDPMRDTNVVVRKQRLTYAAVFVNGAWYLTGTLDHRSPARTTHISHRAFIDLLAGEDISDAEVATAFEWVN